MRQTVQLGTPTKAQTETKLKLLNQVLLNAGKAIDAIKDAKDNDEAIKGAREAVVACIKQEALDAGGALVAELPLGGALKVGMRLAYHFAQGVGLGIQKAQAGLDEEFALDFQDDDAAVESAKKAHRRVGKAVLYLSSILEEALAQLGEEVLNELSAFGLAKAGEVAKDVFGQLAKQLWQQNEILSAISQATREKAAVVPEFRRAAYGRLFGFAVGAFVRQFGRPGLAAQLGDITSAFGSKEDFEVALLAGLIKWLTTETAKVYAKEIQLDYGLEEMRTLVEQAARHLIKHLRTTDIELSEGTNDGLLVVHGKSVQVPASLQLFAVDGAAEWREHGESDWLHYQQSLYDKLSAEASHLQMIITHARPLHLHPFGSLNERYRQDVEEGARAAQERLEQLVSEFGLDKMPAVEGFPDKEDLATALRRRVKLLFTIDGEAGLPVLHDSQ